MASGLKELRTKYAGGDVGPRPASVDEYRWAVFTAFVREGKSLTGIGAGAGISSSRVSRMLYEVDARLDGARSGAAARPPVTLESRIEDLALSPRALQVLHNLGCDRVQDVLRLSSSRRMGPKTRVEVCAAFERCGFPPPATDAARKRGLDRGLGRLRVKYVGEQFTQRPEPVNGRDWAVFTAYFRDGRSTSEIGAGAGLSASRVSRLLYDVDARLSGHKQTAPARKQVAPESPIEDLGLSLRALNVLHRLGCHKVQDILGRDLSSELHMGPKTWSDVRAALRRSGFPLLERQEPWDLEIRTLDRSLVRIRNRVSAALSEVAKDIAALQERLQKRKEMADGLPPGAAAWPTRLAETSQIAN